MLGTLGHLTALRRVQVGDFHIDAAIALADLESLALDGRQAHLLPVDACINLEAELALTAEQCARVQMGQRLNVIEQLTDDLRNYISATVEQQHSHDENSVTQKNGDDGKGGDSQGDSEALWPYEIPVDIRLVNEQGQFIGLGAVSLNGRLQPKKLIQL